MDSRKDVPYSIKFRKFLTHSITHGYFTGPCLSSLLFSQKPFIFPDFWFIWKNSWHLKAILWQWLIDISQLYTVWKQYLEAHQWIPQLTFLSPTEIAKSFLSPANNWWKEGLTSRWATVLPGFLCPCYFKSTSTPPDLLPASWKIPAKWLMWNIQHRFLHLHIWSPHVVTRW